MLEDSLHSKLLQMEEHLLTSIARGPESVQEFERSWSAVQAMVESSFKGGLIDEETLVLAQQVVSRVEVIAQVFLDHHEESDNLAKSLQQDLEGILADLTLDDVFFGQLHCHFDMTLLNQILDDKPQNSRRSMSVTTLPTRPPYLEIAYQWLLANMHNPYPSKATKTSIAVESGGSIKDVESWFRGVRKRIGWSALKAKHFSNKRSQIVEAATLFFKPSLPTTSQPQVHNLSFMTMMNCVKELYPELSKAAVFDRIHGSENLASEKHKRKRQPKAVRTEHAAQLYPSPVASPVQRPTQHQPHKRRRSSTPISDLEDSDRPQKRHRFVWLTNYMSLSYDESLRSESSDNVLCKRSSMLLPSPSPSPQPSSRIAPNIVTASIPSSASSNQSLSKRKRCTSQLDDQQPAKRPHLAPLSCEPRSLSHSLSIDNWLRDALNANGDVITDFPAAVTTETFDNLSPLDIGVYQYDFSPDSSNFALLPESPVTNGALGRFSMQCSIWVLIVCQITSHLLAQQRYYRQSRSNTTLRLMHYTYLLYKVCRFLFDVTQYLTRLLNTRS